MCYLFCVCDKNQLFEQYKIAEIMLYHLVLLFQSSWAFVKWKLHLFSITDPLISQFVGYSDFLIGGGKIFSLLNAQKNSPGTRPPHT